LAEPRHPASLKSVLLATDLSARCDRALDRALLLTADAPDSLVAVHVIEKSGRNERVQGDAPLSPAALHEFPELAGPGRLVVAHGPVPTIVARLAHDLKSDLIVTGVARYNSVGDFILGTAVDHLVRHAEIPVLVVKSRARSPYRRLVVASDFSSCSREALIRAAAFFPDAAITLVHAYHVPYEGWLKSEGVKDEIDQEVRKRLDSFLTSIPDQDLLKRVHSRLDYGEPHGVVCRALREEDADLLVLGTHGRSGFAHATIGSWAADLLGAAAGDVLLVRELPSA